MANQLFEDGKVIDVDGQQLECTAVSYTEVDGEKTNFAYTFRLKSEVDAEREAAAKAEAERQALENGEEIQANAAEPESAAAPEQERTHYVK